MERKNLWETYTEEQIKDLEVLCESYKNYLDIGKTERECIREAVKQAKEVGYKDLNDVIANGEKLTKGDKVYAVCMDKTIALFNIGEEPLENGMNILGAHVDSPRIDLKQNPLYEAGQLSYFDTHYYGGVKKYQWVTIPLAIHGVVVKKDGTKVEIVIGEDENDPVLVITDLLIHLAQEQLKKEAAKVIEGEKLDVLIGSRPLADEEQEAVKANILKLLKEKYDLEEDFLSAELEVVPAGKARDCGLDRSMILTYGQDDRVCAYTSLLAMFENVFEKKNTAYFGRGLVFNKYTGSRGKSVSNDANAEYVAYLRNVLDKHGVGFQTAELGRVDVGGGGTIAYILANYGMEVIDSGVAVLSMHAPWEVTSKADVFEAYRGYKAFLEG